MRRLIAFALLLTASRAAAAGGAPPPHCVAEPYWTRSWTDGYGQTTYRITAPCFVLFDTEFLVTVSVSDPTWPNTWVASGWEVRDVSIEATPVTSVLGEGIRVDTDATGNWVRGLRNRYRVPPPVNHRIEFKYQDCREGYSCRAMLWSPAVIGTVTIDPYPEGTTDPAPVDTTDPAPADTGDPAPLDTGTPTPATEPGEPFTGGCGSAGGVPALLGVAALLAAAWPRRRVRPRRER